MQLINVYKVPEGEKERAWYFAAKSFSVCEGFEKEEHGIRQCLYAGSSELFFSPDFDAWLVTNIEEVGEESHFRVSFAAANRYGVRIEPILAFFEQYAVKKGCSVLFFYGRIGWRKIISQGYDTNTIYSKRLSDGKQAKTESS